VKRVTDLGSPTAKSALDSLNAALWLLSVGSYSQALFLFHHTIEVALKGLLDEVHVLLSARDFKYELAKWVLKERLQAHRLGRRLDPLGPDSYDPDRTCTFEEAWKRVGELLTLQHVDSARLRQLNKLRNEIAHHGGEDERGLEYLDAILRTALPTLREFYRQAYDGLDLDDYLFAPVARELRVAAEYLSLAKDGLAPRTKILDTFGRRFHADLIIGRANLLFDAEGSERDLWEWQHELVKACRNEAEKKWGDVLDESAALDCVICNEGGIIVAVSGEPLMAGDEKYYDVVALHCPPCGLFLPPSHKDLARLHYGPITERRVGSEVWKRSID